MKEKKRIRKKLNPSNRNILISIYLFLGIFAGLIVYLIYFNIMDADNVINNKYNKRQDILADKVIRGSILSSDGEVLASTISDSEGEESRYYPYGNVFAHVVGYLNNGGYGLESSACYYMLTSNQNLKDQLTNGLSGEKNIGDNIVTTLDTGLQNEVYNALGTNRGSAIVIEPSTGKILAMVSKPDFDPNSLAADWNSITAEGSDSVLLNRATQGLYPPGSTFKIVTLLEYLRENPLTYEDYSYTCDGTFELGDRTINCIQSTAHGVEDTVLSFAHSCNCSFINMGLSLEIKKYMKTAEQLLFNSKLPVPMEYNESQFVLTDDSSEWDIAQTSFGQGKTLITPMHLALIGCAIANEGTLMKPYLLSSVESVDGDTIKTFSSEEYGELMTEEEADILGSDMSEVIKQSFSWLYTSTDYDVAAKSGTAQYGTNGYEHSLFISYSPVENPEIVVAVVIEGGEQRNTTAAEVAKNIYDYYYSNK